MKHTGFFAFGIEVFALVSSIQKLKKCKNSHDYQNNYNHLLGANSGDMLVHVSFFNIFFGCFDESVNCFL